MRPATPGSEPWIRVLFGVNWGLYANGRMYDVPNTDEVHALIENGLVTWVPYPDNEPDDSVVPSNQHDDEPDPGDDT